MKSARSIDKEAVLAMSRQVNLPMQEDRAEELAPFLQNVFNMLDGLDQQELEEITPAFSFKAKWD